MIIDATFWVAVSFFIFLGVLIYFKIPQKITSTLNNNINTIKTEVSDAELLKEESKNILSEYEKKISNAKAEVKQMVDSATDDADKNVLKTNEEFHTQMENRKKNTEDRIKQMKNQALKDIKNASVKISIPKSLESILTDDHLERLNHSYGKSFADTARALLKDFSSPPDLIAFPNSEEELIDVMDWANSNNIAVIPYGGGSSVCGGVETFVGDSYAGVISLDMKNLNKITEVDRESRAARIQAGILGPDLENSLKQLDLTMRHYPQSFEFSTLGGWIATRSGGHYATLYTHIDDFVESTRMVTPSGVIESRRLPGSGAGPSPDRLTIGSEGSLGIITEAWMRLQDRPIYRSSSSVEFKDYKKALNATRLISQSGLFPANCRLLDSNEAHFNGAGDGSRHILILSFESIIAVLSIIYYLLKNL